LLSVVAFSARIPQATHRMSNTPFPFTPARVAAAARRRCSARRQRAAEPRKAEAAQGGHGAAGPHHLDRQARVRELLRVRTGWLLQAGRRVGRRTGLEERGGLLRAGGGADWLTRHMGMEVVLRGPRRGGQERERGAGVDDREGNGSGSRKTRCGTGRMGERGVPEAAARKHGYRDGVSYAFSRTQPPPSAAVKLGRGRGLDQGGGWSRAEDWSREGAWTRKAGWTRKGGCAMAHMHL
jgi:hypothetical protein